MEVNPLSIILVKSDSKGARLLFRYPYHKQEAAEPASTRRKNPYTLPVVEELLLQSPPQRISNISKGVLTGFTDEVLAALFAVKPELCKRKFELKVNDVRFVSHPTKLQLQNKKHDESGLLINIVFALHAAASPSVVNCYHDLSKRMGILLEHEENRCGYISKELQIMMATHDEGCALNDEAIFDAILSQSTLAKNIKRMYEDLCGTGFVIIRINNWIPLSYCLPQKMHQWHLRGKLVEPEDIHRCIQALKPYHSILLLCPVNMIVDFISLDGSPSLHRMLSQYSPVKNLQTLAIDTDLELSHIFDLTSHLVYWAKATVIYPICSTNKYVIAPDAPLSLNSPLLDRFGETFPNSNLIRVISDFSLPTSLGQKCNPMNSTTQQSLLVPMIIWMLQHHLLLQLHTYIQYLPTDQNNTDFNASAKTQNTPRMPRVRLESESGQSTISDGFAEGNNRFDMNDTKSFENMSFTSVEDDKPEFREELLLDFSDEERSAIFKVSNSNSDDDLKLFARLCRKNYFQGNHHIEEIMFLENLSRSQLLQLLDKFRDVLITYETEDPTIAMFSTT